MDEFMGVIKLFAGTYAPQNWAFCDGSLIQIQQNAALYSLLGTQFGGNGQSTFALPDLRGRVVAGAGNGPGLTPRQQGTKAGTESVAITGSAQVALTAANLPSHTHAVTGEVKVAVSDQIGAASASPNNVLAKQAVDKQVTPVATTIEMYTPASAATFNDQSKLGGVSHNLTTGSTGTGTPLVAPVTANAAIMQPFIAINYIICVHGIYPPRS